MMEVEQTLSPLGMIIAETYPCRWPLCKPCICTNPPAWQYYWMSYSYNSNKLPGHDEEQHAVSLWQCRMSLHLMHLLLLIQIVYNFRILILSKWVSQCLIWMRSSKLIYLGGCIKSSCSVHIFSAPISSPQEVSFHLGATTSLQILLEIHSKQTSCS